MSLWVCPTHGLYGGDVFCPKCGGTGAFATLSPLERAKASHRPMQSIDELVGLDREPAKQEGAQTVQQPHQHSEE